MKFRPKIAKVCIDCVTVSKRSFHFHVVPTTLAILSYHSRSPHQHKKRTVSIVNNSKYAKISMAGFGIHQRKGEKDNITCRKPPWLAETLQFGGSIVVISFLTSAVQFTFRRLCQNPPYPKLLLHDVRSWGFWSCL